MADCNPFRKEDVALTWEALSEILLGKPAPAHQGIPFSNGGITGRFELSMTVARASCAGADTIWLDFEFPSGGLSTIQNFIRIDSASLVPGVVFNNPSPNIGAPIGGTDRVPGRLGFAADGALVAGFPYGRATAGGNGLAVEAVLNDFAVEAAMASAVMAGQAVDAVKARVVAAIREALLDAITGLGANWRQAELMPAASFQMSRAARSAFVIRSHSVLLLHDVCGTSGSAQTATRPSVAVAGNGAVPDKMTVMISNQALLSCLFGPTLVAPAPVTGVPISLSIPGLPSVVPFVLPGSGFVAGHPLLFLGRTPLAVPGTFLPSPFDVLVTSSTVTSLMAGIDASGLRVVMGFEVAGPANAFVIKGTAEQTYAIAASIAGDGSVVVSTAPLGPPRVLADVVIAAWLYAYIVVTALAGVSGGSLVVTATAIGLIAFLTGADESGGRALSTRLATVLAPVFGGMTPPAVTIARPRPTHSPVLRSVSTSQGDARVLAVSIALGGGAVVPFVDPILANDMIIHIS